ncbi:MAG: methyltransferase [Oceanicoccus sp.]
MKILLICAIALGLSQTTLAASADITEKIKSAMASDLRTAKETSRDKNRRPVETLIFFGLQDDMKVLELFPGGGWYTKILAPVMNENGKLYEAMGTTGLAALSEQTGFNKMEILDVKANVTKAPGDPFYSLTEQSLDFGVSDLDIVFTFRNYHNFSEETRNTINQAAFNALKAGGVYAVVDHTRRHMQATNDENRRRIDPVLAIKEIQAAGFVLDDYSTMHYRLDDELRYEVGRKTVAGNTDRFTLKFRKP